MRWRTPRCGALAEGHANERMEARSETWIRAVCRGGGTGARLSSEACPPDSGLLLPAGEPERVIRIRFAIGITSPGRRPSTLLRRARDGGELPPGTRRR